MASPFKLCGEELCQNHVRLFSTDEATRHYQDIGVIVLTGEVRYFCMARPLRPQVQPEVDGYSASPMKLFLDIPKEQILAVSKRPGMEIIK